MDLLIGLSLALVAGLLIRVAWALHGVKRRLDQVADTLHAAIEELER